MDRAELMRLFLRQHPADPRPLRLAADRHRQRGRHLSQATLAVPRPGQPRRRHRDVPVVRQGDAVPRGAPADAGGDADRSAEHPR